MTAIKIRVASVAVILVMAGAMTKEQNASAGAIAAAAAECTSMPHVEDTPGDLAPQQLQMVDENLLKDMSLPSGTEHPSIFEECHADKKRTKHKSDNRFQGLVHKAQFCSHMAYFNAFENNVDVSQEYATWDLGNVSNNHYVAPYGIGKTGRMNGLNFQEHGVTVWDFSEDATVMGALKEIQRIALTVEDQTPAEKSYMEDGEALENLKPQLAAFLEKHYEHKIELHCSTSVKTRLASDGFSYNGTSKIPGNTLFHVDYYSLEAAWDRLYNPENQRYPDGTPYENPANVGERVQEELVDIVNFWAPVREEPMQDWMLGFVPPAQIEGDYIGVELVVNAIAGTLRGKDVEHGHIYYEEDISWGRAYVFKASAKKEEEGRQKTVPFHGAFRVFPPSDYKRKSVEARCGVFKVPSR